MHCLLFEILQAPIKLQVHRKILKPAVLTTVRITDLSGQPRNFPSTTLENLETCCPDPSKDNGLIWPTWALNFPSTTLENLETCCPEPSKDNGLIWSTYRLWIFHHQLWNISVWTCISPLSWASGQVLAPTHHEREMYGSIVRLDRAAAISQFFLHWANVASFGILSNSYLSVGAENWRDSQLWFALGLDIYEYTRGNSLYFYSILYFKLFCKTNANLFLFS